MTRLVVHQAQEPWRNAGEMQAHPSSSSGSSPRKLGDASIAQRQSKFLAAQTLHSGVGEVSELSHLHSLICYEYVVLLRIFFG